MAITFRQLEYFLALSEELHFGNAAKKLNISQPPLSASLKQLEETLGFSLMTRTNRSVQLTAAGAVYASHAARILGQLNQANAIAAQTALGTTGQLTVSFVPSMLFRHLPSTLRRFQEAYPKVELNLHEMNTTQQIEGIAAHRLDVGFIHEAELPSDITDYLIETERLVCCLPRGHRLSGRSRIAIKQLAGEKILGFSREYAESNYDKIAELLHDSKLSLFDGYKLRNWFTIVTLVGQGMGVSVVPQSLASSDFGNVAYVEIEGQQAEHRVSMIHHRDGANKAAFEFSRFIKTVDMIGLTDRR